MSIDNAELDTKLAEVLRLRIAVAEAELDLIEGKHARSKRRNSTPPRNPEILSSADAPLASDGSSCMAQPKILE